MTWELVEATDVDCTMDDSGIYTVIHRVVNKTSHKERVGEHVLVRVDIMSADKNDPLISFIGKADNVRKHVIRWIDDRHVIHEIPRISFEHASHIGSEIKRAELDPMFVQD